MVEEGEVCQHLLLYVLVSHLVQQVVDHPILHTRPKMTRSKYEHTDACPEQHQPSSVITQHTLFCLLEAEQTAIHCKALEQLSVGHPLWPSRLQPVAKRFSG